MKLQHWIALFVTGWFIVLASYCYARYQPTPMKTVWATPADEQLAEVWGLTTDEVAKPVELWRAKDGR